MNKRKVQVILFRTNTNNEKEFLLLKTNERRGSFWQSVTGGVEENEEYKNAAVRESIEETACPNHQMKRLLDIELDFEFHDQWGNDVKEKVFLLEIEGDFNIKIDPSEHQDYKWVHQSLIDEQSVKYEMNYKALKKCIEKY